MFQFHPSLEFLMSSMQQNVVFNELYSCYSVAELPGSESLENGGKILLPPTALFTLTRNQITSPMLFKLTNQLNRKCTTHAGVHEFVAAEGRCYMPTWMMKYLKMKDGDLVDVAKAELPTGNYSKFQPLSCLFLEITNPKAVLENELRKFACLTEGDVIAINYNNMIYELKVLELKPKKAVQIIECDMSVEFEKPIGYEESEESVNDNGKVGVKSITSTTGPFLGYGVRLDGKEITEKFKDLSKAKDDPPVRGIPDYDFKIGTLTFDRSIVPISDRNHDQEGETVVDPFHGQSYTLKVKKQK